MTIEIRHVNCYAAIHRNTHVTNCVLEGSPGF